MFGRKVPQKLRYWFIIHFWIDILFAIPLFLIPIDMLQILGWESVDIVMTRLVAAALFAIGIESWLGRNANIDAFLTMLRLKILWSATATLGLLWSIMSMQSQNVYLWSVLMIFIGFHFVWIYWYQQLRR